MWTRFALRGSALSCKISEEVPAGDNPATLEDVATIGNILDHVQIMSSRYPCHTPALSQAMSGDNEEKIGAACVSVTISAN